MADDLGYGDVSCYGATSLGTPHIDQLAADGLRFERHYVTTAICMASRANIMTGKYEYKNGTNFMHGDMREEIWAESYPILLRKAGYQTAFAGKFGFNIGDGKEGSGRLPENDFDRWGGGPGQTFYETAKNKSMAKYAKEYPHSTLSYGAFSRDFIKDASQSDAPFCLSISFKAAHRPTTPDPQFDDVYAGQTFTKPGNYGREFSEHFALQSKQGRQYVRFEEWGYSDRYDEVMAVYYQQIYGVDVAVGMIREALEDAGVSDNTVVIFTSDNGFFCGSHGYGSKVLPYEEASRVPLIVYDPRHACSGRKLRSDALTGNVDFAPTILELAELPIPDNVDGKSLLPLYDDPTAATHDSLPLINVWGPKEVHSFGVVTADWKYIYWPWAEGEFEATEEFYDLQKDRLELQNLAAENADADQLETARDVYDEHVERWKANAVDYHRYKPFGTIFDRAADWGDKRPLYASKKRK